LLGLLVAGAGLSYIQTSARVKGKESFFDIGIRTVCSPVGQLSGAIADSFQGFFSGAFRSGSLQEENEKLKRQISYLSLYSENISRLEREINSLRSLNELSKTYQREKVFTDIIGYFPLENRITLSAGANKGIRPGMPVVSAEGLVGRIQTVGPNESQALLLTSAATKIGAVSPNHNPAPAGLLVGENSQTLVISFQTAEAPVQNGDLITTPPFSDKVPGGIVIGRVISVESLPEIGASRARVLPAANVGNLREVVIIK
jgi:rod shape-determining protein MreC